jgi:formyltetrahydrofolate-dependent phosphoribosylglycinamide formyltransferase
MFDRLQKKWKVNNLQLVLILCTFAIGGSTTGFVGKKIMNFLSIGQDWLWAVVYILLITIIWPMAVLLVSIPFGQFSFFLKYIRKIGSKMGLGTREQGVGSREAEVRSQSAGSGEKTEDKNSAIMANPSLKRIAIFASGAGTNAEKIIEHFRNHSSVKIALIATNNHNAGVLKIAEKNQIPTLFINKEAFFSGNSYINELKTAKVDFIILAGFLWKIPSALIKEYQEKIINIHPALLPKFGGKGMYGQSVHEAVISQKEKESGITIHYVDEIYDHGKVIFQAVCPVLENDTPETLAVRIHALEHEHFPKVIEQLLKD